MKNLTLICALTLSIFSTLAHAANYETVLGTFQGMNNGWQAPCSVHAAQDAEGAISIEVVRNHERIQFPNLDSRTLQQAIDQGFEGQFSVIGPKGWYLGGMIYSSDMPEEARNKLAFVRIQHDTYVSGPCFYNCVKTHIDLTCQVN